MRAVEFTTGQVARVVDLDVPSPGRGEVLVRITSAGICGSDLSALRGGHPWRVPPLITGHEGGGVVIEVGSGVDPSWVDRPVALEPQRACSECDACDAGLPHLCRNRVMLGMAQWPGTLAEYVTAPTSCLHPVDAAVPPELLALAEPLAVDVHAVAMGPSPAGARVAVLGAGPIGALLVHLARVGGAGFVAATDPRPAARAVCERLGADRTADPTADGWRDGLGRADGAAGPPTAGGAHTPTRAGTSTDRVDGAGFDVVYVAATAPGVIDDAIALLRPRGTVVQVGMFSAPQNVDLTALQRDEKTLVGTVVYTAADFAEAAAELGRSWSVLAGLVTDGGGLDGAVDYLHARIAGTPDDVIKLLVRPGENA